MESLAAKERMEKERKAELNRQIAALQAQVSEMPDSDPESRPSSPKRRKLDTGAVLAPTTPSPKKKERPVAHQSNLKSLSLTSAPAGTSMKKRPENIIPSKPAASTLLSSLAKVNRQLNDAEESAPVVRSAAFTDAPMDSSVSGSTAPQRDDRLAIIENLDIGPADHKPCFDDPHFQQLEPNSGIRLSSRIVSHEDLQDHLRGRYYLSPSRLYSAVRLLPDKQGYDVPVSGDWITIAVVAERGPYKYSKAPVEITPDEEDGRKGKAKEPPKPSGKKFINLKLVDFGATARSASSATGGKAVIRGDALLSLLLFESDGFEMVPQSEGRPKKVYRGGSRGAFEEMCDLKEGDVVALLNPRILKPFQRSNDTPHPTTNILALTPESASSILVVGRAKDLGLCVAVKRDGKVCKSWCDKRVSDVCEWHVQHAVERARASRPEFSAGTSGMSTTAGKRKSEYDPRRKWGLKPLEESSGATYVFSGHIVSGGRGDPRDSLFISESMGREGQAKASRKLAAREDARVLKALQGRDAEGMKPVMKAREVGLAAKEHSRTSKSGGGKSKQNSGGATESTTEPKAMPAKSAFSAQVIKNLGFDPTLKPGQRRHDNLATKKKLDDLALLQASRKPILLGPRPGEKIRSGVVVPSSKPKKKPVDLTHMHDFDSDSDVPAPAQLLKATEQEPDSNIKMVDLDFDD